MKVPVKFNIVTFFIITFLWISSNSAYANKWHTTQISETLEQITTPTIAIDGNNVAHITWITTNSDNNNSSLHYANSKSDWIPITITNTAGSNTPSIFIDKKNSVYIAWNDRRNGPNGDGSAWDVYYASSIDGWDNHLVTSGPTVGSYNPSIVVDATGDVYITFRRFTTADGRWPYNTQLFFVKKSSGWLEERISFTGFSRIYWSDMDIDDNGIVHVAFSNGTVAGDPASTNHIWYANSTNNWLNIQVDTDVTTNWWDDRTNPSIDIDSNNVAHIVWQDQRNTVLNSNRLPNRVEIYYANTSNTGTNSEIALPVDMNKPKIKTSPSIFVQNNQIHATWIQKEANAIENQMNLFYSNSSDWDSAINISNFPDKPIADPSPLGTFFPSYFLDSSSNALAIDKDGAAHITWKIRDNINNTYKIYYATNIELRIQANITLIPTTIIHYRHINQNTKLKQRETKGTLSL